MYTAEVKTDPHRLIHLGAGCQSFPATRTECGGPTRSCTHHPAVRPGSAVPCRAPDRPPPPSAQSDGTSSGFGPRSLSPPVLPVLFRASQLAAVRPARPRLTGGVLTPSDWVGISWQYWHKFAPVPSPLPGKSLLVKVYGRDHNFVVDTQPSPTVNVTGARLQHSVYPALFPVAIPPARVLPRTRCIWRFKRNWCMPN